MTVLSGGAEAMAMAMAAALGRLWERAAGGRLSLLQQVAVHPFQLRSASVLTYCRELPISHVSLKPKGTVPSFTSPVASWSHQQIRTKTRGNEYQPNNRKRKRTHGWIKRISTPAGIEVILRRMLKGRKSLTH